MTTLNIKKQLAHIIYYHDELFSHKETDRLKDNSIYDLA